jgi:lysophospholipase L1-like esterase
MARRPAGGDPGATGIGGNTGALRKAMANGIVCLCWVIALSLLLPSLLCSAALSANQPVSSGHWVATWTAAPMNTQPSDAVVAGFSNQTIREIVRVTLGGQRLRIRLSNEYGSRAVPIESVHVALSGANGAIQLRSDRRVTFGGSESLTLLPGSPALSDPIEFAVAPLEHISVSTYFKDWAPVQTYHPGATQTAFLGVSGNSVAAERLGPMQTSTSHYFLSGVLVESSEDARTVVAFGDSITDGALSTVDADRRYPDRLAERVLGNGGLKNVSVVNQGLGGNRLVSAGRGASGLARFDRDVLTLPHASHVVLLEGINDIGWPGTPLESVRSAPTFDTLVSAYRQLIARSHAQGIKLIVATILPFQGAFEGKPFRPYYNSAKDQVRRRINDWIRNSHEADGVVDLDAIMRDPSRPGYLRTEFDGGDGLHPNDAGCRAIADSIDLTLLQ